MSSASWGITKRLIAITVGSTSSWLARALGVVLLSGAVAGCLPNSGQSLRSLQALGSGGSSNQTSVFGTGTSTTGSDGEEVGEDGAQDQCLAFDEYSATRPLCVNCYDDLLATYCPGKTSYEECSDRGFLTAFPTLLNQCIAASTVAGFVCSQTCLSPKRLDEASCSCVDPDLSSTGLSAVQRMDRGQFDVGPPVVTASFPQSGIIGFGTADEATPHAVSACTATLNSASTMSSIFLAIRNRGETLVRNNRLPSPTVSSSPVPGGSGGTGNYLSAQAPGLLSTPVFGQNGYLNFQFQTGGTAEIDEAKMSGTPGVQSRLGGAPSEDGSTPPTTPASSAIPDDAPLGSYTGYGRPYMMASDQFGNVYFTDDINGTIQVICHDVRSASAANIWCNPDSVNDAPLSSEPSAGDIVRIAGGGSDTTVDTNSGGLAIDEKIFAPRGIAVDDDGNVYFSAQRFEDAPGGDDETDLGPYIGVVCAQSAANTFCGEYDLDSAFLPGGTTSKGIYRVYGGSRISGSGRDAVFTFVTAPIDDSTAINLSKDQLLIATDGGASDDYDVSGDDFEGAIIAGIDIKEEDGDVEFVFVTQPELDSSLEDGDPGHPNKSKAIYSFATDASFAFLENQDGGIGGDGDATLIDRLSTTQGYPFDVKRNKNDNLIISSYNPGGLFVWCHERFAGDFCDKDVHGRTTDFNQHELVALAGPSSSADSGDEGPIADAVFTAPGQLIVGKKHSDDYTADSGFDDNNVVIVSLQKLTNSEDLYQEDTVAGGSTIRVLCGDNSGAGLTDGWCKGKTAGNVYSLSGIAGESSIAASGGVAKGTFAGSPIGGTYDRFKNILFSSGWRLTQHLNATASDVPFIDNSIMRIEYTTETPVSTAKYTFTDSNNFSSYYCLRLKAQQACAYNFDDTEGFVATCSCQLTPVTGDAGSFWTGTTATGTCN